MGPMAIMILGSQKNIISDISTDVIYIYRISAEFGHQTLVTKILNGGRVSYI